MTAARRQVVIETDIYEQKARSASKGNEPHIGEPLARLLGCPYVNGDNSGFWVVHTDLRPCDVDVAKECLLRLLTLCANGAGSMSGLPPLLIGVHRHEMLEDIVATEAGAYTLAVAILLYVQAHWIEDPLDMEAVPFVLDTINAWLKPAVRWTDLPAAKVLAAQLFGDSWVLLEDDKVFYIGNMLNRERPPFLSGLCHQQDVRSTESVTLPDMESP